VKVGKISQLTQTELDVLQNGLSDIDKTIKKDLLRKIGNRKNVILYNGFPKSEIDWEAYGYNKCYDRVVALLSD